MPIRQRCSSNLVAQVCEVTELPIVVGFGIRTAEQAAAIGRYSDAVLVGSALVDCIEHANTSDEAVERVHGLVSELAESVRACRR
ncbi:MAG: tryptophan synthase subunit alpha [Pseudomonadota bacterium]